MYNRYIKNKDLCIIYKLYEIGAKKREGGKKRGNHTSLLQKQKK